MTTKAESTKETPTLESAKVQPQMLIGPNGKPVTLAEYELAFEEYSRTLRNPEKKEG